MVRYCFGCKKLDYQNPELSFHRLPSDAKRKRIWLEILQLHEVALPKLVYICSRHFTKDDLIYQEGSGKTFLKKGAVPMPPTIGTEGQISSSSFDELIQEVVCEDASEPGSSTETASEGNESCEEGGGTKCYLVFPRNAARKKKWIVAIKRKDFQPTDHMRVCSKHFVDNDYQTHLGRKKLKASAVPSLFNFQHDVLTRNKRTDSASSAHTDQISPEKNALIKSLLEPKEMNKEQDVKPLFTLNDYIEDLLKTEVCSLHSTEDLKPEVVFTSSTNGLLSDLKLQHEEDIKPVFLNEYVKEQPENAFQIQNLNSIEDKKAEINETDNQVTPENVTIKLESDLLEAVHSTQSEALGLHHEEDIKPVELNEFIEEQSSEDLEVKEETKESEQRQSIKTNKIGRSLTQDTSFDDIKEQDLQSEEAKQLWRVASRQIRKQRSTIAALNIENRILLNNIKSLENLVTRLKKENKVS